MTVVRKCDSYQGGVKSIRKVCQLMERCDGHGGCKGLCEGVIFSGGVTVLKGVKDVRKVCQLMERSDAHWRSVQELREV